jgi:hypothetical protein
LCCVLAQEIEEERKMEMFRDYVGQTLWVINTIQHFKTTGENNMPQYIELSHPELKKNQLTANEIKQHILDRLKE